jgi:hypothetical protein
MRKYLKNAAAMMLISATTAYATSQLPSDADRTPGAPPGHVASLDELTRKVARLSGENQQLTGVVAQLTGAVRNLETRLAALEKRLGETIPPEPKFQGPKSVASASDETAQQVRQKYTWGSGDELTKGDMCVLMAREATDVTCTALQCRVGAKVEVRNPEEDHLIVLLTLYDRDNTHVANILYRSSPPGQPVVKTTPGGLIANSQYQDAVLYPFDDRVRDTSANSCRLIFTWAIEAIQLGEAYRHPWSLLQSPGGETGTAPPMPK